MGGEERGERSVDRGDELDRLHVRQLRQAEPAVLAWNLDAEGTELLQSVDDLFRNLAFAIDAVGIDLLAQKALEAVEEGFGAGDFGGILLGIGMDEIHPQVAQEELADETRRRPFLFARGFGDVARFFGTDFSPRCFYRGHGPNVIPLDTADGRGRFATPSPENSMRHVPLPIVIALSSATVAAQAPPAPAPAPPPPAVVFIKAGRLVDGRTNAVQTNVGILVEGERIKVVGPVAQVQSQAGTARVIDLSQMTVLPGLIDAHTHLLLQGDVTSQEYEDQLLKQSIPYRAILAARNARLSLEHGFTAIRDVETEGAMYADVDVKLAVNRGEIPGPRIFASTRAMAPTGMYPIGTPNWELELPHGVQPVDGVDNARLAVRQQVQHGADWIKYYSDRRYYFTPDSVLHSWVNFTDAEAKAIVDEAHRIGRPVAAHAIGSDGIAAALRGALIPSSTATASPTRSW